MSFLAANTQDGFGEHRDKKYPMCTMKYTAVFLMLWAYISAGGPGHLVQTQTSKTTQKWVSEHKTKILLCPFQSSDLNPIENEWGELKRRSTNMELGI